MIDLNVFYEVLFSHGFSVTWVQNILLKSKCKVPKQFLLNENMSKCSHKQLTLQNGLSLVKHVKNFKKPSIMKNTIPFHVMCIILLVSTFSIITTTDASSSENVYIRSSYGQLVTSSTLR